MKIFIDTSAWDAIEDSGDPNHELALAFKDDLPNNCHLITSNYVLDETYTLLLLNVGYERTVAFQRNISELLQTGILAVVHVTSENPKLQDISAEPPLGGQFSNMPPGIWSPPYAKR